MNGLPQSFLEDFASAQTLTVEQGKKVLLAVALTKADKAVAALRDCDAKLLAAWGVDTKAMAALKTPALPLTSPSTWFPSQDYPTDAINRSKSGTVVARYTVEASGAITNCEAVGSSGSKELDAQTCRSLLARASYAPAIGPSGAPTASQFVMTVNWMIAR